MTRPHALSKQTFSCSCGGEHPLYEQIRIAGIPVLLCPECPDTGLHPYWTKTNGLRLITGDGGGNAAAHGRTNALAAKLETVLTRLVELEKKMRKGGKETE